MFYMAGYESCVLFYATWIPILPAGLNKHWSITQKRKGIILISGSPINPVKWVYSKQHIFSYAILFIPAYFCETGSLHMHAYAIWQTFNQNIDSWTTQQNRQTVVVSQNIIPYAPMDILYLGCWEIMSLPSNLANQVKRSNVKVHHAVSICTYLAKNILYGPFTRHAKLRATHA